MAAVPNRQNTDVVGGRRSQNNLGGQIRIQESPAKEDHRRRKDQPSRRKPLHGVNRFVVEREVIDQQDGNSRARIKDERRPARPAINSNLVEAESEKICAEQPLALRFGFGLTLCGRHGGNYGVLHTTCPRPGSRQQGGSLSSGAYYVRL